MSISLNYYMTYSSELVEHSRQLYMITLLESLVEGRVVYLRYSMRKNKPFFFSKVTIE